MKKSFAFTVSAVALLLAAGLFLAGCPNDNDTTTNTMLTYLTTVNTPSGLSAPLNVTATDSSISTADENIEIQPAIDSTYTTTMEEFFAGGQMQLGYRLNRTPDPSWLIEREPVNSDNPTIPLTLIITNLPTTAQYVFFLQKEKKEDQGTNDTNRRQAYSQCYSFAAGKRTHIEGQNWMVLIYDQINHALYGNHKSVYVTPDLESVVVVND